MAKPKKEQVKLLTVKEALNIAEGLTEYTLRKMIRTGVLPHIKLGNKILIPQGVFVTAMKDGGFSVPRV